MDMTSEPKAHQLALTLGDDCLVATFSCVDHEKCELVEDIEAESLHYSEIPVIMEWYVGEKTPMRDGAVRLFEKEAFVGWSYIEDKPFTGVIPEPARSEYFIQTSLSEDESVGPRVELRCTHDHSDAEADIPCWTNEADIIFGAYSGKEKASFRDGFIRFWVSGTNSYWTDDGYESNWDYV